MLLFSVQYSQYFPWKFAREIFFFLVFLLNDPAFSSDRFEKNIRSGSRQFLIKHNDQSQN